MLTVATIASIAATLAGTTAGLVSEYQQVAKAEKVHKYNADVMRSQAEAAEMAGAREEELTRQKAMDVIRQQNLAYGKARVSTAAGTPLMIMAETASRAEMEALNAGYAAKVGAERYRTQADLDEELAAQARTSGWLKMGTSFLAGAGQLADTNWSALKIQ